MDEDAVSDRVPNERALDAAAFVSKHSVALLIPSPASVGRVGMTGSGALVRLNERCFILTATHVVERTEETRLDSLHFRLKNQSFLHDKYPLPEGVLA
jgi:hypothetical protein